MQKFAKRIIAMLSALVILISGMLFFSGTAQAVWGCSLEGGSYWARSYCAGGLGAHRVALYCWNGSYDEGPYRGAWASAGQYSTAICGGGKQADGSWIEYW